MTYLAVARMAADDDLLARVTACVAREGDRDPELWTQRNKWAIAAQPSWDEAWDYATNLDPARTDIGRDPAVITDGQILSAVQSIDEIRPRGAGRPGNRM